MHFYQWLVPLISLFFIYRIILQFKANRRLLLGTVLWVSFWIVVAILGVFPDFVSNNVASWFGFANNINAIIFVALGFLFLISYHQSSTIEGLEKQLTELVRKLALEEQKVKELKKRKLDKVDDDTANSKKNQAS